MELFSIHVLIQTLLFLTQLPTCRDGFQNCDEVYLTNLKLSSFWWYLYYETDIKQNPQV